MKTVIIINTMMVSWFDFYHWETLLKGQDIRLVGIYSGGVYGNREFNSYVHFDALHFVPIEIKRDAVIPDIDLSLLDTIVADEIRRNPVLANVIIIGNTESDVLWAAQLREKYGIAGVTVQDMLPFRNKYVMKQKVSEYGIKTAKFLAVKINELKANPVNQFKTITAAVGLPFIIKPILSASSSGVFLIHSPEELKEKAAQYQEGLSDIVLCEQFISGKGYSCNSVVYNKKVYFSECSEYLRPQMAIKLGKTIGAIPLLHCAMADKIKEINKQLLDALGLVDGISHAEYLVDDKGDIYFLEVAGRAPGTKDVPYLGHAFGINLLDLEFLLTTQVYGNKQNHPIMERQYGLWALIPKIAGKVAHLHQPNFSSHYELQWKVKEGDVIGNSESMVDHGGYLIALNKDYQALCTDFQYLNDHELLEVI